MSKQHTRIEPPPFSCHHRLWCRGRRIRRGAMPSVLRAQGGGVKIGLLHPITGALAYSGQQGRIGATMAVDEINAAGGIKALGAKIDPVLGDAQSTPDGGPPKWKK